MDWRSMDTPAGHQPLAFGVRGPPKGGPAEGWTGAPWLRRRDRPILGQWTELSLLTSCAAGARQSSLAMSVLPGGPDDAPTAYAVKTLPS